MSSVLLAAETDFALNLLRQTPAAESTVFSPLSIAVALSVLFSGAKDKTKNEIGDVILKGATPSELESHFGKSVDALRNLSQAQLDIATRFFLDKRYEIHDSYKKNVQKHYNADAVTTDFVKKEHAAQLVNDFVSKATHGKISELVKPEMFPGAVAFLINAVYFNAKWELQFDSSRKADFYSKEKISRKVSTSSPQNFFQVDMMVLDGHVRMPMGENELLRVAKIPYKDPNFSMAVILPKKRFGLREALGQLTGRQLQDLFQRAKEQEISLWLPKFHLETSLQLEETLQKLGIRLAFSDAANFSAISELPVKVSAVIHKAVITVDEAGTEAAAATAVRIIPKSFSFSKDFHADEPFLYAILFKDRPLFFGQYF